MLFLFRFEAKRVIIRQGHKAENFYFILSGTGNHKKSTQGPKGGAGGGGGGGGGEERNPGALNVFLNVASWGFNVILLQSAEP